MAAGTPGRVRVYEVGPRDGLQNEPAFVPTEDKVALIDALATAGLPAIEATSFVNPRWIPPLADAENLCAALRDRPGLPRITALVPNEKGLERALAHGLREVAVFMSASESHNKRNINKTRAEALAAFAPVFERCRAEGVAVRAYVSVVWGCPYEGPVSPAAVLETTERLLDLGAYEVSLGDTIGVGHPRQTRELLEALLATVPADRLAMHMHDTRGTALANCLVGLEMGIRTFDSSVGGLGGCPYAPGASGNLATEDLVYMLHGMGFETGVDLDRLVAAGMLAEALLGRPLPGRALKALAATCTTGPAPSSQPVSASDR
ncbi:hydroxymethylglutaryl-CoA lyase [Myxococcota bacterium]|nr:hydroxymethylglutaryl-CoA lyase [Myxococcota bacterium]